LGAIGFVTTASLKSGRALTIGQRLIQSDPSLRETGKQAAEALAIAGLQYRDGLDNYLSVSVALHADRRRSAERSSGSGINISSARGWRRWSAKALPLESKDIHSPRFPPIGIPAPALQ
jgi:hypothetical protein